MFDSFFANPLWQTTILGNTLQQYAYSVGLFLGLVLVFWVFQHLILFRLQAFSQRTATDLDDLAIRIVSCVRPWLYASLALLISLRLLVLEGVPEDVLNALILVLVTYQVVRAVQIMLTYSAGKLKQRREENPAEQEAIETITKVIKGTLWVIGFLVVLQNVGIEVTSLIAGLGIGGIAIAFALQNILGDLFSSFAIIFDKPFEPGDFIIVGEDMGVVEKIGIKTTRIRALQGEEIVISNAELTSARIQNFKKMQERRVTFAFGVVYDTSAKTLRRIPTVVEEIVNSVDKTRFDRAHFHAFAESSLNFEVVYYVQSADYNEYMDIHQQILSEIKERFDAKQIGFAFPTRTVYLEQHTS